MAARSWPLAPSRRRARPTPRSAAGAAGAGEGGVRSGRAPRPPCPGGARAGRATQARAPRAGRVCASGVRYAALASAFFPSPSRACARRSSAWGPAAGAPAARLGGCGARFRASSAPVAAARWPPRPRPAAARCGPPPRPAAAPPQPSSRPAAARSGPPSRPAAAHSGPRPRRRPARALPAARARGSPGARRAVRIERLAPARRGRRGRLRGPVDKLRRERDKEGRGDGHARDGAASPRRSVGRGLEVLRGAGTWARAEHPLQQGGVAELAAVAAFVAELAGIAAQSRASPRSSVWTRRGGGARVGRPSTRLGGEDGGQGIPDRYPGFWVPVMMLSCGRRRCPGAPACGARRCRGAACLRSFRRCPRSSNRAPWCRRITSRCASGSSSRYARASRGRASNGGWCGAWATSCVNRALRRDRGAIPALLLGRAGIVRTAMRLAQASTAASPHGRSRRSPEKRAGRAARRRRRRGRPGGNARADAAAPRVRRAP